MNEASLLYLWRDRTLFLGHINQKLSLSQGAATLCVSLDGPIQVSLPESSSSTAGVVECTSVLLPPGCKVTIDTLNSRVCNLNLDVMGQDYHALSSAMSENLQSFKIGLKSEKALRTILEKIFHNALSSEQTWHLLNHFISQHSSNEFTCDQRVRQSIEMIQSEIEHNISIDDLAERVNLSVPGLSKLFKKQTGVPIRRYRQWHRLFITANEIGKGKNLTDAALTAGFVDLSHCTHTFNLMLGMKPSYFLQRPGQIRVISETSEALNCSVSL